MILLDAISESDGTLSVYQTDDCAYYVEYDNRIGGGLPIAELEVDGASVVVYKYAGEIPEEVFVYVYGKEYHMTVQDETVGVLCVEYWVGA